MTDEGSDPFAVFLFLCSVVCSRSEMPANIYGIQLFVQGVPIRTGGEELYVFTQKSS